MKSFILSEIADRWSAESALDCILPGQRNPWLLLSGKGDAVAYFHLASEGVNYEIQADISGRHYHEDEAVRLVLTRIAHSTGGIIEVSP